MKNFNRIFDPDKLSTFVFYSSILTFIIAFNFSDHGGGGWQQQFLPYLNNRPLSDITFLDSLTGYGITGDGTVGDTNYIIKTTNGGDNWFIVNSIYRDLSKLSFINQNTGFVCGGYNAVGGLVIKTTNGGNNWFSLNASFANHFTDIFVLNEDTIWLTDDNGFNGGIFRTNNGGLNWFTQFHEFGNDPARIYMLNSNTGFISGPDYSYLSKTTNGGFNWTGVSEENGFSDIYFSDTLNGLKALGNVKKTTDGGNTWIEQQLPPKGGIIITSNITKFSSVNRDTIWGAGGQAFYGSGRFRGIIYRTTDGGNNWFIQIPDTSFHIFGFYDAQFISKLTGWSFGASPTNIFSNVHTIVGGDTTFLTKIDSENTRTPTSFILFQNYPNPFNPKTIISYQLDISSKVILRVYDVRGNDVKTLVNEKKNAGRYEIEFDGNNLSSGVYFYHIRVFDKKGSIYTSTKRMILLR